MKQLISYIPPGAPARRREAAGPQPFFRLELGFTPKWYHQNLGVRFGREWHEDPHYRFETIVAMSKLLQEKFKGISIGWVDDPENPADLITGAFGICFLPAIYGIGIEYKDDNWPWCKGHISDTEMEQLEPPDLDSNPFFSSFLSQLDAIEKSYGSLYGFINWQGVLNNAYHLRGEQIFLDMLDRPEATENLFRCITDTMIEGSRRLHRRQEDSGVSVDFVTTSNCLVNLVSPDLYATHLLRFDRELAEAFGLLGLHNCAWNVDPYIASYGTLPNLGYIDMGIESNLAAARSTFPDARRAVLYRAVDLAGRSRQDLREDLEGVAAQCGPCDLVCSGIEAGTPDEKIFEIEKIARSINKRYEETS